MPNRLNLPARFPELEYAESIPFGLTPPEVRASREMYGENILSKKERKGFFASFLESFGDPVIKILLIALAVNTLFVLRNASGGWFESIGIAVAILLATLVSTLSEYGCESAFEKLQEEASKITCRVKRAGVLTQIGISEVVKGDIIQLQSGDRIPADGVIIQGKLEADQSALNGESKEALKYPADAYNSLENISEFLNPTLLFSGTTVCGGEGWMCVTAVGDNTFYGRIGAELQEETRESPLKVRLGRLAGSIGKFSYFAAAFSAIAYLFNAIALENNLNWAAMLGSISDFEHLLGLLLKALTIAVTVVVMAVPEGLPMMITVVLSANMKRMLRDNVLVRKLVGIETAGSLNILFSDKTGTITIGHLEVTQFISGTGEVYSRSELLAGCSPLAGVLRDALYSNCAASMDGGIAIGGNATDRALLSFACQIKDTGRNIIPIKTVPFSSERKYMATQIIGDWNATLIKGAPEKILPLCRCCYDKSGRASLAMNISDVTKTIESLNANAVRIIAVAVSSAPLPAGEGIRLGGLGSLTLVGLLGIRDDIRPEAINGISQMQTAGIQTVMITGDSRSTALAIAKESGLTRDGGHVMTSDDIAALSDRELAAILPRLRVVARALPSDKSRLVRVAQGMGLVVGMTGDGVNDAPALKQADIGFAMGSGTEVAKEAGDIVILDDNFLSISKAVCYGRSIFKSIRKFIIYQMSICMCAVGVSVFGPLIGVDFPITVIQMLWINIVMDTLAGLAFSGERPREKYMREPPKARNEPIINRYMAGQIALGSMYTCLLCLFFLKSPLLTDMLKPLGEVYRMTAFFALFMFCAIISSFCARTHSINLLDYLAANKRFLWIMGAVTCIQTIIIYYGGTIFRTMGLEPKHLLLTAMLAATIIPVDAARKYLFSKFIDGSGT